MNRPPFLPVPYHSGGTTAYLKRRVRYLHLETWVWRVLAVATVAWLYFAQ